MHQYVFACATNQSMSYYVWAYTDWMQTGLKLANFNFRNESFQNVTTPVGGRCVETELGTAELQLVRHANVHQLQHNNAEIGTATTDDRKAMPSQQCHHCMHLLQNETKVRVQDTGPNCNPHTCVYAQYQLHKGVIKTSLLINQDRTTRHL